MELQIGCKVVYPNHGVGIVEQIGTRNLTGFPEVFYLLKLNGSSLRVMVPTSSVASVGLRKVASNSEINLAIGYLAKGRCKSPQDWKGRFKENSEKMRRGTLLQIAEVFKSLLLVSQHKPLSFREKKMLERCWHMIVDEIALARGLSPQTVESQLIRALSKSNLKVTPPS